jgi:hypothetical protein
MIKAKNCLHLQYMNFLTWQHGEEMLPFFWPLKAFQSVGEQLNFSSLEQPLHSFIKMFISIAVFAYCQMTFFLVIVLWMWSHDHRHDESFLSGTESEEKYDGINLYWKYLKEQLLTLWNAQIILIHRIWLAHSWFRPFALYMVPLYAEGL